MPRTQDQYTQMKDVARNKIMSAALYLFSHKGLAATSIINIANKAGVSSGLLYHYFLSKEDLFRELVSFAVSSSSKCIDEIVELDVSAADKIGRISIKMLELLGQDDTMAQYFVLITTATLEGSLAEETGETATGTAKSVDIVAKIIAQGQRMHETKEGNPYEMALLYWAAVHGLCSYKLMMGEKFCLPSVDLLNGILLN